MAKPPRLATGWLIALVFLSPFVGTALYVAVFRMADCPQEIHRREFGWAWGKYRCFRCEDRGRITILNRWLEGKESREFWEGMEVSTITATGLQKMGRAQVLDIAGLRPGIRMSHQLWKDANL